MSKLTPTARSPACARAIKMPEPSADARLPLTRFRASSKGKPTITSRASCKTGTSKMAIGPCGSTWLKSTSAMMPMYAPQVLCVFSDTHGETGSRSDSGAAPATVGKSSSIIMSLRQALKGLRGKAIESTVTSLASPETGLGQHCYGSPWAFWMLLFVRRCGGRRWLSLPPVCSAPSDPPTACRGCA